MPRKFNVAGICVPGMHYMVNTSSKISQIMSLIDKGKYFAINRPRQYGKTTIMHLLGLELEKQDYLVIDTSFEGVGDVIFNSEEKFSPAFLEIMGDRLEYNDKEVTKYLYKESRKVKNLKDLSKAITNFAIKYDQRMILMIDEVDKACNNQLFLSFIGILRDKYLLRNKGKDKTFYSVILASVHDVKNLNLKLKPGDNSKLNSPWNIAVDFDVVMTFSSQEIETMLDDYLSENQNINMDTKKISEKIYYLT